MAIREHSVTLKQETYEALEAEAERRHVAPDDLADELVRHQLTPDGTRMKAALEAADRLVASMPPIEVDAVQLVREGREELERRTWRWQSS
jgi:hypothetical protein